MNKPARRMTLKDALKAKFPGGPREALRALGLDQIPESLFPLLACRDALSLTALDIALAVAIFFIGELVLSRLLYRAHFRDQPY